MATFHLAADQLRASRNAHTGTAPQPVHEAKVSTPVDKVLHTTSEYGGLAHLFADVPSTLTNVAQGVTSAGGAMGRLGGRRPLPIGVPNGAPATVNPGEGTGVLGGIPADVHLPDFRPGNPPIATPIRGVAVPQQVSNAWRRFLSLSGVSALVQPVPKYPNAPVNEGGAGAIIGGTYEP